MENEEVKENEGVVEETGNEPLEEYHAEEVSQTEPVEEYHAEGVSQAEPVEEYSTEEETGNESVEDFDEENDGNIKMTWKESLGLIGGFDIVEYGKIKAKKDDRFVEIEKVDSSVKEELRDIVNNEKGFVFAIVKKKIIYGLYLFEKKEREVNGKKETYVDNVKKVFTDEVPQEVRDKYEQHIISILKEVVAYGEYDKVLLEDKVIEQNKKATKGQRFITWLGGFAIGCMFGMFCFGDLFGSKYITGVVYGVIFAPIFGGVDILVRNKRKKK